MKRTLDGFLISSESKKAKLSGKNTTAHPPDREDLSSGSCSNHSTYPFPVPHFPSSLAEGLGFVPAAEARLINDKPDLDLRYYSPYIPSATHKSLFDFLRRELFFYRVKYKIKRGSIETDINTPRWTTVFGIDATSHFSPASTSTSDPAIIETSTGKPISKAKYNCTPRPLPHCLNVLREITEAATGETFNFCLVNYYASGADSISYHSDDERFLGADPAIASLSLGATRDFLMRHKPLSDKASSKATEPPSSNAGGDAEESDGVWREAVEQAASKPMKFALKGGDMVLMRGKTQSRWLHSIPKRKGPGSDGGRINITFRKALVKAGTENYYQYNVGSGEAFKWDKGRMEMMPWAGAKRSGSNEVR